MAIRNMPASSFERTTMWPRNQEANVLLHPDGKGELGKERNWPQDKTMVESAVDVVSFVLDNNRYSVCYLNHPNNPKETRFSERDYARFGGYFQQDVTGSSRWS